MAALARQHTCEGVAGECSREASKSAKVTVCLCPVCCGNGEVLCGVLCVVHSLEELVGLESRDRTDIVFIVTPMLFPVLTGLTLVV